ncbi:MAG TPA: high-potential iron-sulfur protein [Sandaracinaceae bacterium LLY-WYZ-13_1]|nr:high-potential iron-sulfur protein [Sandaracinaceae bacterium LLY-WYZ-13_1]
MGNGYDKVTRRRALRVIGVGGLSAGLVSFTGCGGEEEAGGASGEEQAAGTGCDAPIDAQSQQLRSNLQYRDESQVEGRRCSNCAQYLPDEYGRCGGCNVFSGPVQPGGHCLSWAAQEEAQPAADEAPAETTEEAPAEEPAEATEG